MAKDPDAVVANGNFRLGLRDGADRYPSPLLQRPRLPLGEFLFYVCDKLYIFVCTSSNNSPVSTNFIRS